MPSPFDSLHLPRDLAFEFVELFSRFEYCLKAMGYVRPDKAVATPTWQSFAKAIGSRLVIEHASPLAAAIAYLTQEPPRVQMRELHWESVVLKGKSPAAMAIDATCRVRNNLFHGGKFGPHSPPGRDEALVRNAVIVLRACLAQDDRLHAFFYDGLPRSDVLEKESR